MVGFIREPAKEDKAANQQKLKTPTKDSESYKFGSGHYSPELDEFSFAFDQPFLDFDAIKDWIEEMQDPEREEANKVEIGSGLQAENCLENPTDKCLVDFVKDLKDPENSASGKVEYSGIDGNVESNGNKMGEVDSVAKSDGLNNCIKAELVNVGPAEICCNGNNAELNSSRGDEPCTGESNCPKFEGIGCSIEEGLEKVSLGGAVGSVGTASKMEDTEIAHASDDDSDSASETESESETSSSSSSSNESAGEEEEEGEEKEKQPCKIMIDKAEQRCDVEEGEIMEEDAEKMVSWSDNDESDDDEEGSNDNVDEPVEDFELGDDEEVVTMGPVKSKNELVDLPPVPPVNVMLQPCHQILPVGVVLSMLGPQVIVEGSEKHNPLSEGSILWITEKRLPLGLVDEIFGPVKTPYYIVRYNSESEVPSGIQIDMPVGFVPEFVDHVLNDKNLYKKGYDASGENDEEVLDEVEFSDDDKEAEYKRMMKMSKRGNNDNQGPGKKRKNRRNLKSRDGTWTKGQTSAPRAQTAQPSQSNQKPQHVSAPPQSSLSQGNQSGLSSNAPNFPAGSSGPTSFPQQAQVPAGFPMNGLWANGMPFQQQNMGLPTGFQMNGMPWLQLQNPPNSLQMPSMNPVPWQQQQLVSQLPMTNLSQQPFDLSQLGSGSGAAPLAPVNFATGPGSLPPWPGLLGANPSSNQIPPIFPGPGAQLPMYPGMQPNGRQAGQNCNSQPAPNFPGNVGVRPQFNQGSSSGGGRGRKPFQQRGGGGRFGGGRGRQHSK